MRMSAQPCILFTAFEPSGDEHAAPVIRRLRALRPDLPIYALGGPKMADAGATIIEDPTERAAMGVGAVGAVAYQLGLRRRFKRWLADHPVAVHVPTDSPAANWALCKLVKKRYARQPGLGRVAHLVAPQVWAWASWRVRRLQKWSDRVLCLLPFEPDWFEKHNVAATFIGHPIFDEPLPDDLDDQAAALPDAPLKLAILPGSRTGEIHKNAPAFLHIFRTLADRHPDLTAVVASYNTRTTAALRTLGYADTDRLQIVESQTPAALHWADVVLSVSGTASLHIARHGKPMVLAYHTPAWQWHLIGRWVVNTALFTLPNLIAAGGPTLDRSRAVVPEFAPHWGAADPITLAVDALLTDASAREKQSAALADVVAPFADHTASVNAADAILEFLEA